MNLSEFYGGKNCVQYVRKRIYFREILKEIRDPNTSREAWLGPPMCLRAPMTKGRRISRKITEPNLPKRRAFLGKGLPGLAAMEPPTSPWQAQPEVCGLDSGICSAIRPPG